MSVGGFYNSWLFTGSPFSARPLGADFVGNKLLVGREEELRKVCFRLASGSAAICLDGPVGVGKTSLANIAAFRAEQAYLANPRTSPLLIPCRRPFQVSNEETPDQFRLSVLTEVAQTLLEKASKFRIGLSMEGATGINAWLNSPLLSQWNIGVPVLSVGTGSQANESNGYTQSGFTRTVTNWLESIFPEERSGAVVCVLDNLELLETSAFA